METSAQARRRHAAHAAPPLLRHILEEPARHFRDHPHGPRLDQRPRQQILSPLHHQQLLPS